MRGVHLPIALAMASASIVVWPAIAASNLPSLAKEKAAAVTIYRGKAEKYAVALAHGRLFSAYLNASTLSEGERMRLRIEVSLGALHGQYGMQDFTVVDRAGALFVHIGKVEKPAAKRDIKRDPLLSAVLGSESQSASVFLGPDTATFAAPVIRRGEKEFVISIEQNLSAYEKVLAQGLSENQFVVIVSAKGVILADSRPGTASMNETIVAGLSLEQLREKLTGASGEAAGTVEKNGVLYDVSLQAAGDWTVVVAEIQPREPLCLRAEGEACQ